ncbi:hypothetical protein AZZ62_000215, partial [Klebsiella variicola]
YRQTTNRASPARRRAADDGIRRRPTAIAPAAGAPTEPALASAGAPGGDPQPLTDIFQN